MILINFLSNVCFSVVLPSMWPYLKAVRTRVQTARTQLRVDPAALHDSHHSRINGLQHTPHCTLTRHPPLHQMGAKGQISMVGWAVAINSLGTFLASPIFGAWGDKRTMKEVLLFSLILNVAGNVLYSTSYMLR